MLFCKWLTIHVNNILLTLTMKPNTACKTLQQSGLFTQRICRHVKLLANDYKHANVERMSAIKAIADKYNGAGEMCTDLRENNTIMGYLHDFQHFSSYSQI